MGACVEVILNPNFTFSRGRTWLCRTVLGLHVEDVDGEKFYILNMYWISARQSFNSETSLVFSAPLFEPIPPQYFIRVVSDRWLEAKLFYSISFRNLLLLQ